MIIKQKNNTSSTSWPGKENNKLHTKFFACATIILLLLSSCGSENSSPEIPEIPENINTLACKNRPGQISFGTDTYTLVYNGQDKPIEITTKKFNTNAPKGLPVVTVFKIDYNAQGNVDKISKSAGNHLESSYRLEYNSGGKVIKQSEFNAEGILVAYTSAHYDDNNVLTGITTHNESTSVEVTTIYEYENGNLLKKSVENLYDIDTQEYYNAHYTYTYFMDRENKIKPYLEGPMGLLFISNLSNQPSLQYLPKDVSEQLFFAKETPSEKKMLKNIEIIAYRYATRDTTNIHYSYDYDTDGFPTLQKGTFKNITRRYVPTPFGGSALLVTPHESAIERTINYLCK